MTTESTTIQIPSCSRVGLQSGSGHEERALQRSRGGGGSQDGIWRERDKERQHINATTQKTCAGAGRPNDLEHIHVVYPVTRAETNMEACGATFVMPMIDVTMPIMRLVVIPVALNGQPANGVGI